LFLVEGAYTQQGRARIRRLHPDWAARPALMGRAAHAVESKAVVRIKVAVSPRDKFTSETGFELPSSLINLPCYGLNLNRNILDFMRWHQIDLGAQDLNDIQRPKSFQKNSWK
jgi:hypothetical protein